MSIRSPAIFHETRQSDMPRVVALGDVNVDVIARYPRFPVQGQDAFATSAEFHCGGAAANTAMALAGLGVTTLLIARLGSDPWASLALRCLAEAGVIQAALQYDPQVMTGSMHAVVTPDGDRTILGHRGANALTDPALLREEDFQQADLFYLSGYALLAETQRSAARRALEFARRHALTIALDPGLSGDPVVADRLHGYLPGVDLFLPNLAEATELTGRVMPRDCAQALVDEGVPLVALKLGRAGCLIYDGVTAHQLPGFDVTVQDTTGAGDSFAAGLLAGHLAGLDWPAAAMLANAMGALTTTAMGAGGGPWGKRLRMLLFEFPPEPADGIDSPLIQQLLDYIQTLPE